MSKLINFRVQGSERSILDSGILSLPVKDCFKRLGFFKMSTGGNRRVDKWFAPDLVLSVRAFLKRRVLRAII